MSRILNIAIAATFLVVSATGALAQTAAPKKMSRENLREMQAKWKQNKPKLDACKKEVKSKGLVDDDRWFYIENCMNKS
jgi:sulfur relay (sulfurtransferase) complex TusBCD TusD component (DsrE family)